MFSKLLYLYQYVDETMAKLREHFPEEIVCHKGCTDCCNAVFDLSYIESAYLLRFYETLTADIQIDIEARSAQALKQWQHIFARAEDPSQARIRCPLLNDEGECCCYEARPVNCRTYGVPTIINGRGHVCGLSGFKRGVSYPSLNLAPLQQSLYEYSLKAAGEALGERRFPVAEIILYPDCLALQENPVD